MSEYERYLSIKDRELPACASPAWLAGMNVLVTGGTGCIGSKLLEQITSLPRNQRPRKLVSVSRMTRSAWPRFHQVTYLEADVRDERAMRKIVASEKWDVVFHLAAQRDPGLAEKMVRATVTTNVFGTHVVLRLCADHGVPRIIVAGTGKAFRFYSGETYTASKRAAEWLVAMTSCIPYRSGVRFTHVIDNSIVHERLLGWARENEPMGLHGRDILFYVQSALESTQLLSGAGKYARRNAALSYAISDLGFPVDLTDIALAIIKMTGSGSEIDYIGYDEGYEQTPFAGLTDPDTGWNVSPLINPFEAPLVEQPFSGVDAFPVLYRRSRKAQAALSALWEVCAWGNDPQIKEALDRLSWILLDDSLAMVDPALADRIMKLCEPHVPGMSPVHRKMLAAIDRARLGLASPCQSERVGALLGESG